MKVTIKGMAGRGPCEQLEGNVQGRWGRGVWGEGAREGAYEGVEWRGKGRGWSTAGQRRLAGVKRGIQAKKAGHSEVVGFGGIMAPWPAGCRVGGPHLGPGSCLGDGPQSPHGGECWGSLLPVPISGTALPVFCPQPKFRLRWQCTVGVSLEPALGPVGPRLGAATPGCRLMEKVRLGDEAC